MEAIPTYTGPISLEEFRQSYDAMQCVWFQSKKRKARSKKRKREGSEQKFLSLIQQTFQTATSTDQASWCLESKATETGVVRPDEFLSPTSRTEGYCSFVLQDDSQQAVSHFTQQVVSPHHTTLPLLRNDQDGPHPRTTDPYWIFVGRNHGTNPLQGRPEHTDEIQHDGTFHYQAVGSKTWWIRPTDALRTKCPKKFQWKDSNYYYKLTLQPGDVLVLNTRLWWHQTEIPSNGVSISIARDFYCWEEDDDDETRGQGSPETITLSNQEGAWAVGLIPKGTKLLCENDNPPMRRVQDKQEANCQLQVLEEPEEDCPFAIVALKDIQESEFFLLWDSNKS